MTSFTTCRNCRFDPDDCDRRQEVRRAIKGAHITSLKFRCVRRQPKFQEGQRVTVQWTVGGEWEGLEHLWKATVIRESGTRFLIAIDDAESDEGCPARQWVENERLFAKVSANKLRALDEPDRAICQFCDRAPAPGDDPAPCKSEGWNSRFPPSCLLAPEVNL